MEDFSMYLKSVLSYLCKFQQNQIIKVEAKSKEKLKKFDERY